MLCSQWEHQELAAAWPCGTADVRDGGGDSFQEEDSSLCPEESESFVVAVELAEVKWAHSL